MLLKGSCHCGAVHFHVRSKQVYPYQRCYCSICRKTQGGGGFAINLSGDATTLGVTGKEQITIYHANLTSGTGGRVCTSSAERHFCSRCGSGLWLFSPEWPELVHPFASVIDTPLPVPPRRTHIMLGSKASWVDVEAKPDDLRRQGYPDESIEEWHTRLGLTAAR